MTIMEGEVIPTGYGVVGRDYSTFGYEVLPMPLHWLKRLWYFIIREDARFLRSRKMAELLAEQWDKGYADATRNKIVLTKGELREFSHKILDGFQQDAEAGWAERIVNEAYDERGK